MLRVISLFSMGNQGPDLLGVEGTGRMWEWGAGSQGKLVWRTIHLSFTWTRDVFKCSSGYTCVDSEQTWVGTSKDLSNTEKFKGREVTVLQSKSYFPSPLPLFYFPANNCREWGKIKVWGSQEGHTCRELPFLRNNTFPQILLDTLNLKAQRTMGFSILKSKESTKLPDETSENAVLLKDT